MGPSNEFVKNIGQLVRSANSLPRIVQRSNLETVSVFPVSVA
jgi:hypothetical protein